MVINVVFANICVSLCLLHKENYKDVMKKGAPEVVIVNKSS